MFNFLIPETSTSLTDGTVTVQSKMSSPPQGSNPLPYTCGVESMTKNCQTGLFVFILHEAILPI